MKLFLDTANRDEISHWVATGVIDGVTTNPSHMSKTKENTKEVLLDICNMVAGDVSIEVVEKSPEAVYQQAKEIAALASNVVVKIPFHEDYLSVINQLASEGVALNITLVFTLLQAMLVAKLGVRYVSPFVGRWDDIGVDGLEIIGDIRQAFDNYGFETKILAASLRHVMHWHHAALIGADIATIPPKLLSKVAAHPLTDKGIAQFDADWQKLGKSNLLS